VLHIPLMVNTPYYFITRRVIFLIGTNPASEFLKESDKRRQEYGHEIRLIRQSFIYSGIRTGERVNGYTQSRKTNGLLEDTLR
jgi:hypothetical protein